MPQVEVGQTSVTSSDIEERTRKLTVGGSITEGLAGLAAVVLSILALAGVKPLEFSAIAMIVIGGALLFEGSSITARLARIQRQTGLATGEVVSSVGADAIAGIAGIALGVLCLAHDAPLTLLPSAAIVLGAGLLFGSAAAAWATSNVGGIRTSLLVESVEVGEREAVYAASSTHVFVGLGAIILGIVGLVTDSPLLLSQVASLALGSAVLLSGLALGGRFMAAVRRTP